MELLEYQAKQLFKMVDIPILPSQTIRDSRKIKQLQIPYPVVLKSQVSSGGRGKAGGVRFVGNTIDAIAAARSIFNLSILGEYPEVILAEAHYNTERELFLAIVLDYELQCPVLLGSALGGMNVDSLLANIQQVAIEEEFSLFYARRLATNMGLSGKLICSVSEIIAKMYRLFREKDLDLIEINPLGVNSKGELMALDGKIAMNDYALARQPVVQTLTFSQQQKKSSYYNSLRANRDFFKVSWRWLDWNNATGKVAIICNSFDGALLTWDLLNQNKIIPACSALLENSPIADEAENIGLYREQLGNILVELESFPQVEAIVLNIWESVTVSREIMQTVVDYCDRLEATSRSAAEDEVSVDSAVSSDNSEVPKQSLPADTPARPRFILRLLHEEELNFASTERIYLSGNLETAIAEAVATVEPD